MRRSTALAAFALPETAPTTYGISVMREAAPRGLNFGLRASVLQYRRKPAFVTPVLRRLNWVPASHYADDYQVPEPPFCLEDSRPGGCRGTCYGKLPWVFCLGRAGHELGPASRTRHIDWLEDGRWPLGDDLREALP